MKKLKIKPNKTAKIKYTILNNKKSTDIKGKKPLFNKKNSVADSVVGNQKNTLNSNFNHKKKSTDGVADNQKNTLNSRFNHKKITTDGVADNQKTTLNSNFNHKKKSTDGVADNQKTTLNSNFNHKNTTTDGVADNQKTTRNSSFNHKKKSTDGVAGNKKSTKKSNSRHKTSLKDRVTNHKKTLQNKVINHKNKKLQRNELKAKKHLQTIIKAEKIDNKIKDFLRVFTKPFTSVNHKIYNLLSNKLGYATITIKGLNTTKLINTLKNNNIEQLDTCKTTDGIILTTKSTNLKKLKKILDSYGYKYTYRYKSKIINFFDFILKKQAIAVMLLVATLFYLVSNMFVLKISVNTKQTEVYRYLDKAGIKIGTRLSEIDTYKLEKELLQTLYDISFCDIKIKGNTLYINITEGSTVNDNTPQDISQKVVATKDCILSRQLIYSGTPTKKFGDVIRKGDILVQNFIMVDDTLTLSVYAVGDIYGFLQDSEVIKIPKINTEKVPTGRKYTTTDLSFNKHFNKPTSPYKLYEVEENTALVSTILPIYKHTTTFIEYCYKDIKYDKNSVIQRYAEPTIQSMINKLSLYSKYNRSWYDIVETENEFILTCYIEYEDKVSTLSSLN